MDLGSQHADSVNTAVTPACLARQGHDVTQVRLCGFEHLQLTRGDRGHSTPPAVLAASCCCYGFGDWQYQCAPCIVLLKRFTTSDTHHSQTIARTQIDAPLCETLKHCPCRMILADKLWAFYGQTGFANASGIVYAEANLIRTDDCNRVQHFAKVRIIISGLRPGGAYHAEVRAVLKGRSGRTTAWRLLSSQLLTACPDDSSLPALWYHSRG
jgi:hypothetical protein